jgi:polyamine oxidase
MTDEKLNRRKLLEYASFFALTGFLIKNKAMPSSVQFDIRNRQADVVIVGAGMSGIAAARELTKSGLRVIVLEGRERLGGRIWSSESLGAPIDLGAAWIHGTKKNPLKKLAAEFEIETVETDFDNIDAFDAQGNDFSADKYEESARLIEELMNKAFDRSARLDSRVSLASLLREELEKLDLSERKKALVDLQISMIENDYADELDRISAKLSNADAEFEGYDLILPGGFLQLLEKMAVGLDIRLNSKVSLIDYGESVVKVNTSTQTFLCKKVLVTVPLGVLKKSVSGSSSDSNLKFFPELSSEKRGAIERIGMGTFNKVALQFDDRYWPKKRDCFAYASNVHGEYPLFINMDRVHGKKVHALVATCVGNNARRMESLSDEEIVGRTLAIMRKMFGSEIPEPIGWLITRWNSDEFSRGSYSHMSVESKDGDRERLAEPVLERLFFAGEATESTMSGTVHGALVSGLREAARIL